MPSEYSPNVEPRYYARPASFRCAVGAAAITIFPSSATVGGVQAAGSLTFGGQPADSSSVTIAGTAVKFVTSGGFSLANIPADGQYVSTGGVPLLLKAIGPTGLQVNIGGSLAATLANLVALSRAWPESAWANLHFKLAGNTIQITHGISGTGGNAVALAASSSPSSNCTVSGATLSGGVAATSGYAMLVEPQAHPVELQYVWGIGRVSLAAGALVLALSDGSIITKADAVSFASQSVSSTAENTRISFANVSATQPLLVPANTGLLAYATIAYAIDLCAGPGGVY